MTRNRLARERIVEALGGAAACQKIPVVKFDEKDLDANLKLGDKYISRGQHIVQLEDSAGRTAIVMFFRLKNSTSQVYTATAHQLYRETSRISSKWALNFDSVYQGVAADTERVADFIEKVQAGKHGTFIFMDKP